MATPQLPGYAASPLASTGLLSREWYRYLKWLGERETATEAVELPEYKLVGPLSIVVSGLLQNGLASVALKSDELNPEPRACYGTDDDGAKGWHLIADALAVTADLTKSVDGTTNVATFGLADLADSGVGAALVRLTRDAKGRISGTQAATTDHLTEGATNLYHTAARVRDTLLTGLSTATNAVIAATDSVLSALGKLQAQVSAAMPGALVVSGTNVDYTYVSADANVARGKTTSTARLYTLDASVLRVGAFYYAANYASSGDVTVQPAVGTTLRQAGASVASVTVGPFVLTRFWIRSATEIWTM